MNAHAQWSIITSVEQFYSVLDQNLLCAAYFTSPSCFRCKQVEPKITTFPLDFPEVSFLRVDVDDVEGLGDIVSISVLPSFILYRDGQEVHRLEGAPQRRPARALAQAISTHLLSSGKQ